MDFLVIFGPKKLDHDRGGKQGTQHNERTSLFEYKGTGKENKQRQRKNNIARRENENTHKKGGKQQVQAAAPRRP